LESCDFKADDILVFQSNGVTVDHNVMGVAQTGVAMVGDQGQIFDNDVFDVSGRRVATPFAGKVSPGAVTVDWAALARAAGIGHVASAGDVAGLREAFGRARAAGAPALVVVEVAFDPAEAIPPYSERPDEIRARFRL